MAEKALRTSVSCISLAMPSSLLRITSSVIGSTSMSASRQQKIAVVEHGTAPAWLDQCRGVGLFDDRGTGKCEAGRHRGAMMDRRLHQRTRTGDANRAR